jgi:segregation and condensation protein A
VVPDTDYRIKLQVFEGPLDLLLFLIRKNELDIYDIPIESVTKQYLQVLRAMQQLDLDVAGEFFVMAATLMEIKSRMLLPKGQHAIDPNADDEEVDPRWELVHQLLQYKKFKEAAAELAKLAETRQGLMERHMSSMSNEEIDRPLRSVDRIELWNSFNIILRRLAEKLVVGEIHDETVTVADQMEWLLARTQTERSFVFTSLFPEGVTLRKLVATFLAMLELTRLKRLRVRQHEAFADIVVEVVDAAPAPGAPANPSPEELAESNASPTQPTAPGATVPDEQQAASGTEIASAVPAAESTGDAPLPSEAEPAPAATEATTDYVPAAPPPPEASAAEPAPAVEKPLESPPPAPTVAP